MTHKCTKCGSKGLVQQTRTCSGWIQRRLHCRNVQCRYAWTTYEVTAEQFSVYQAARRRVVQVVAAVSNPS